MKEIIGKVKHGVSVDKLQFLTMSFAEDLIEKIEELEPWLNSFTDMVVIGIGGSALGTRFLQKAFYPEQDEPTHTGKSLWVVDNLNSARIARLKTKLQSGQTLIVVVSKSGNTLETVSQYLIFKEWLINYLGAQWADHVLCITDAQGGFLRSEVNKHSIRSFEVPKNLGGRYSVLSAVGLVPASFGH